MMILNQDEMRGRIERVRVVRLATVDERGRAHVVPVIFAVDGDIFYSPTDKPKDNKPRPKRLRNLDHDQRVTVLADFYDEDWLKAWWVRLRGTGRVVGDGPERTHALGLVDRKYSQFDGPRYLNDGGPVLAVDINHWRGWAYSDRSAQARGWRPWRSRPRPARKGHLQDRSACESGRPSLSTGAVRLQGAALRPRFATSAVSREASESP